MEKLSKFLLFTLIISVFTMANAFSQSEPDPFAVDNNRVSASDLLDEMEDPDALLAEETNTADGTNTQQAEPAADDDEASLDEILNEEGPDATTPDIQGAMTEGTEGMTQQQTGEGITAETPEEVTGTAVSNRADV